MDTLMILGIILFIAGFILIAIEMVIPGFGAPGISGIACLIAGVFLTADSVAEGAFITVIVLALLGIMMAVIVWLLSKGKKMCIRDRPFAPRLLPVPFRLPLRLSLAGGYVYPAKAF